MDDVYFALEMFGTLGGLVFCLYSVAFRWRTLTHTYGRVDLWVWVMLMQLVFAALATAAIYALWGMHLAIWYALNPG